MSIISKMINYTLPTYVKNNIVHEKRYRKLYTQQNKLSTNIYLNYIFTKL